MELFKGYKVVIVRNSWKDGSPYKGINVTLEKDGVLFELQYHTQESFDLKNGELHELYELARDKQTKSSQRKQLTLQMVVLSDKIKNPKDVDKIK